MKIHWTMPAAILVSATLLLGAADGGWLRKVSDADRKRTNPYAGQPEAIAAGKQLYENSCAKCHGEDALGRHGRPALRSHRVASATDGELAWILKNGSTWKGMPSWSTTPEPERWQIVAYLRSLQDVSASATTEQKEPR